MFRIASQVIHSILERKLPWRLSQWIEKHRLEFLRRKYDFLVDHTPSFVTNAESLDFEIHSLLGTKHVGMCLWAIKSLLHYSGKQYSVVLHDDGSLTDRDIRKLEHHLVNVKVIKKASADNQISSMIEPYPNVFSYRFGTMGQTDWGRRMGIIFSLKLVDFSLLANASKILALDTDVLFFKRPDEIIQWAENPINKECLYAYEEYKPIRDVGNKVIGFQKKVEPQCWFNSGLICLDESAFNLAILEDWLGKNKERVDKVYTFEQQAYNHLVHQTGNHSPLPASYSFNYNDPECVATHFGIKLLFFKNLERIRQAMLQH